MSIAVDQTRLRRIVDTLMPGKPRLDRAQATTILQFVQLAAGADHQDEPHEHAIMQSIAQCVGTLAGLDPGAGLEPGDMLPIPPLDDDTTRGHWLAALGANLTSRGTRELAYAFAFLVSVADLELVDNERATLESLQRALDLDDRRATDLVVFLTEIVAASDTAA